MSGQPKMLAQYDNARKILVRALESTRVEIVMASRADLDHIKLHARQVRDRGLLADAYEFQMRVERHLGTLLNAAVAAGELSWKGRPEKGSHLASLSEIGILPKLSAKAKAFAALNQQSFDEAVSDVRDRIAGGTAKLASVIDDAGERARKSAKRVLRGEDGFNFPLADGTLLGSVKLGKIRSRIEHLTIELKILKAVSGRVGSGAYALASVEDSISAAALGQIIEEAIKTVTN